jgi:hypothetical protein
MRDDNVTRLFEKNRLVVDMVAVRLLKNHLGVRGKDARRELLMELKQVGYVEAVRTILMPGTDAEGNREGVSLPLDKRIARNCSTVAIRFLEKHTRHRSYLKDARCLAIRQHREKYAIRPEPESLPEYDDDATATGSTEAFPDWLCGSSFTFSQRIFYVNPGTTKYGSSLLHGLKDAEDRRSALSAILQCSGDADYASATKANRERIAREHERGLSRNKNRHVSVA